MAATLEVPEGVRRIPAAEWDACAPAGDPFTEHAFLALLEESGCVGPGTGWLPVPLVLRQDGRVVAAAPVYLRDDSYGEYIFDWAWARAAQEAGLPYYPKLTAAVPFTPATGRRLLVHPQADLETARTLLGRAARDLALRLGASGVHWLFCTRAEASSLAAHLVRHSFQLVWTQDGYADYQDFLSRMRSKRRKEVRRERRRAASHGLEIVVVDGEAVQPAHWRAMQRFYLNTHALRPWQRPYLGPDWWGLAPERLAHRVVMCLALDGARPVAGSLALRRGGNLYGRYWGADADLDALHFELCYHQLVEYAIREGLDRVEAGAQGGHKLYRGFTPEPTWSAHWLAHPGLHRAVARFVAEERVQVHAEMDRLHHRGPFRRGARQG